MGNTQRASGRVILEGRRARADPELCPTDGGKFHTTHPGKISVPHRATGGSRTFPICEACGSVNRFNSSTRSLGRYVAALQRHALGEQKQSIATSLAPTYIDWPVPLAGDADPGTPKAEFQRWGRRAPTAFRAAGYQQLQDYGSLAHSSSGYKVHAKADGQSTVSRAMAAARMLPAGRGFCTFKDAVQGKMVDALHQNPQGEATGRSRGFRPATARGTDRTRRQRQRVNGIVYVDGDGKMQKQKARVVAIAGNSLQKSRDCYSFVATFNMFPDGSPMTSGPGRPQLHAYT